MKIESWWTCVSIEETLKEERDSWILYMTLSLTLVSSLLGLWGSSFVINVFLFRGSKLPTSFLVFSLGVCDFLASSTLFLFYIGLFVENIFFRGDFRTDEATRASLDAVSLRMLYETFVRLTFFFTLALCVYILASVLLPKLFDPKKRTSRFFLKMGLVWAAALALVAPPIALEGYRYEHFRYYFTLYVHPPFYLELFLWNVPMIGMIVILLGMSFVTVFKMRFQRLRSLDASPSSGYVAFRLFLWCFCFIVCWMPDVIIHVIFVTGRCYFLPLDIIAGVAEPLQGLFNVFPFVLLNPAIRKISPLKVVAIALVGPLGIPVFVVLFAVRLAKKVRHDRQQRQLRQHDYTSAFPEFAQYDSPVLGPTAFADLDPMSHELSLRKGMALSDFDLLPNSPVSSSSPSSFSSNNFIKKI